MPQAQAPIHPLDGVPQPGDELDGKYRLERLIGIGGMGVVMAATHLVLDQPVAIKFLTADAAADPKKVERFSREAWTASKITSDHVCRVLDVSTLPSGAPYMVMEFLEGEDLQALARRQRSSVADASGYVLQAMEAVAEAHELGVVHRDLKPGNLFVTRRVDGSPWIKVLDFGISKVSHGGALTNTRSLLGSPLYMAPEQMTSSKHVDPRSDIWPLGIILYQLVSGTTPFSADTLPEICMRVLQAPPDPLREVCPEIPPAFEEVVLRCLEKDPSRRYQNLFELAEALAPFAGRKGQASVAYIRRVLQTRASDSAPDSAPDGANVDSEPPDSVTRVAPVWSSPSDLDASAGIERGTVPSSPNLAHGTRPSSPHGRRDAVPSSPVIATDAAPSSPDMAARAADAVAASTLSSPSRPAAESMAPPGTVTTEPVAADVRARRQSVAAVLVGLACVVVVGIIIMTGVGDEPKEQPAAGAPPTTDDAARTSTEQAGSESPSGEEAQTGDASAEPVDDREPAPTGAPEPSAKPAASSEPARVPAPRPRPRPGGTKKWDPFDGR